MRPLALIASISLVGCSADAPPALTVGPVSYTKSQTLGLTGSRLESLVSITALALAVADSTTAELGAPLVTAWTEDRLLEIFAAELTLEKHGVGDAALEDAYRRAPEWELTVEHILVFSERWQSDDHRRAAAQKAARAHTLLTEGMDFPAVEARLADEGGADARAGELPPGREGAWVPEFWAAALALQPGELSPVTETQYGYHVLRLEDRSPVPFFEARASVARRIAAGLDRPAAVLDEWTSRAMTNADAQRVAALAEARTRGLEVPPGERAELARRWEDQTAEWAVALGLAHGLSPAQVAEAALAALARTGQGADLARRALAEHAELLRARYPVGVGTEPGAAS